MNHLLVFPSENKLNWNAFSESKKGAIMKKRDVKGMNEPGVFLKE